MTPAWSSLLEEVFEHGRCGRVEMADRGRVSENGARRGIGTGHESKRLVTEDKALAKNNSFEKRKRTRPGIVAYSGCRSMLRKRK